jgi:transcriptional regulator with XRE-family HTH domain
MIRSVQIRAARVLLRWKQKDLADAAGVSFPTIQRMEINGPERSSAGNVEKVQRSLEHAGVIFIDDDDYGGIGVRLRNQLMD